MKAFLRFMLFLSRFEAQIIAYRQRRLSDSLVNGDMDVNEYVERRKGLDAERKATSQDIARLEAALHASHINQGVQA